MNFELNEEQQMLADTVERLVRNTYGFEQREGFYQSPQGYSPDFWRQLSELGITSVPIATDYEGFGGTGVENMLVMKELGRGLCLEPYLHSQVYAAGLIQQLGSLEQRQQILPSVASGEQLLAVADEEAGTHFHPEASECTAVPCERGWRLSGHKRVVIGGELAHTILVTARMSDGDGVSLFLLDPAAEGVSRTGYPCIDGPKACDLELSGVYVEADALIGPAGKAGPALAYQRGRALAAQCAEALGSMEEAFRLTLEYLKTRQQFGSPIGRFQALQHRMAEMRGELELARSMTILAACVADDPDSSERSRRLAAAKFVVARASELIAEQSIQLHGGIGMTWEYSLAHHAKRLVMLTHQFGDDDFHLGQYSALLELPRQASRQVA
ncbi:acyl-CoA dehydrogenase [Marinobacter pelagius]|uniref:acyl-CoA dehydrogenase family protein n=1 Tax=Marinobacter sp. C7 TaxID=2951363 RepID=UPI001EF1454C|nr:acyl-CoA dehydrogenase [Marinobacter sp. C7]MCG7200233.1 acyl-CoA dehydrogenase [Marinobacter sp. C7]